MLDLANIEQKNLRAFYERRHPHYADLEAHWRFVDATYKGGRKWFSKNIFRYMKEGEKEFADRLDRAYRFNHTREVVELVQKYLFKGSVKRNLDEAPEPLKEFWTRTSLSGMPIEQFMRLVSTTNSIFGRVAVVVDNNYKVSGLTTEENRPLSEEEAKTLDTRVYAYVVQAPDILDYAWDEDGDGELLWVKLRETYRDDSDPLHSSGLVMERIRLWTRSHWYVFEEIEVDDAQSTDGKVVLAANGSASLKRKREVRVTDQGEHGLGFVPVRFADHIAAENPYSAPGLIDDIAYLDRAVANYLSNLDAIIQDQTFSQLAIPAQALQPGEDQYTKILEMGTKRIFVYDAGSGATARPGYISPDPKQAGVIIMVINKIINEIYHTIGLAGERTKEDNAVGIDNSSGVAKAYDFERVNSLLFGKGKSCETLENWMARTVMAWHQKDLDENLVSYPATYDIARLADELANAEALKKIEAPAELRRQQMRQVVEKIFPQLKEDIREKILADIESWLEAAPPPESDDNSNPDGNGPDDDDSAVEPPRQGQVTADTD